MLYFISIFIVFIKLNLIVEIIDLSFITGEFLKEIVSNMLVKLY
jgi:hypothetical protein